MTTDEMTELLTDVARWGREELLALDPVRPEGCESRSQFDVLKRVAERLDTRCDPLASDLEMGVFRLAILIHQVLRELDVEIDDRISKAMADRGLSTD